MSQDSELSDVKPRFLDRWMPKDRLDYWHSVLSVIKDVALVLFFLVTTLYLLFPSFENFVRERVWKESYHFYVGIWNSNAIIKTSYDLNPADYDPVTGEIKIGSVILAEHSTVVGRSDWGTKAGIRKYAAKGTCVLVLESQQRETDDGQIAIWVRGLPNACK